MPRPTYDVPLYWTPPTKGRVRCLEIEQWQQKAGPGATTIRFAELAGQIDDATKVKASTCGSKQPVVAQLDASYLDMSPTDILRPVYIEELNLKSLADLHVHMKKAREQVPADLVVPGKIGGRCLAVLVARSATCTIVSTRKWTQIHRDNPNLTLLWDADRVQVASRASQSIQGKLLVQIELADQYCLHQVIVRHSGEHDYGHGLSRTT